MLSIVIPVYQAKDTLHRCVSSLMNQGIKKYEIILVDDGSTDGSGRICDEIAKNNEMVRVVHQDNKGPFLARVAGVIVAKGEIITFVDADDWIDEGAYETILTKYMENNVDLLLFSYKNGMGERIEANRFESGIYNRERINSEIIPHMMWDICRGERRINPSLCCMIIKRELYQKVTKGIEERIIWGEDAVVSYPMICIAERLMICNDAPYNYNVTSQSCTRKLSFERMGELQSFKRILRNSIKKYCDFNFDLQIDCYIRIYLNNLISNWFECGRSAQMFAFPYDMIHHGEKIKLFGAGDVGKSYYVAMKTTNYAVLTGWYDSNYESIGMYNGERIDSIDEVPVNKDERVLVSVRNVNAYEEIRALLKKHGLEETQIIWRKPVLIG